MSCAKSYKYKCWCVNVRLYYHEIGARENNIVEEATKTFNKGNNYSQQDSATYVVKDSRSLISTRNVLH